MMQRRSLLFLSFAALLTGATATPPAAEAAGDAGADTYTTAQLDSLLAPVALYPDELLAQTLMASTFPLQVIDAHRWVEDPANKALQGDALVAALADKAWDPSVKALVPVPQVLAMLNGKLDWMQDLGYAMTNQQKDVWDAVQRLRRQAQAAGNLKSSEQQVVQTEGQAVVITPAQPDVIYVPVYSPTYVYGAWLYPAYPPVYVPYPPGYVVAAAVVTGIAFGIAVGINRGLWGWATPYWGHGSVNININRYNNINVGRPPINNPSWRPGGPGSGYRPGAGGRPPGGPVGSPGRPAHRPAHQPAHQPARNPAQRPAHQPAQRPAGGAGQPGAATRPAAGGGAQPRPQPQRTGSGGGRARRK
jgi:hypothetical protein